MRGLRLALMLVRLAGRNVLRNRSRSALTFGAIFLGVALTLTLTGFGNGLSQLMIDDVVQGKVGGVQIHRRGYSAERDNQPLRLDLPDDPALLARISAVPGVLAVAPRLVFGGMVSNGDVATMFVGRGIDPAREYQALPWETRNIEGQPITAGAPHAGVAGAELAAGLGVAGGGTLILQATTRGGQQNAMDLDVTGRLTNGNVFESKRFVNVPLSFAQELVRMPGRATEYVVRVADPGRSADVAAALRTALGPDYEVDTWRTLVPALSDVITVQRIVMATVSAVFLVIVVFGVMNTMIMSVVERTREIGTMMALGMARGRIALLFLLEAALLATIGAGAGAAVARTVVALAERAGGFVMAPPGNPAGHATLIPVVPAQIVALAVAASITGALLAALYPSWRATKLRPVEALRAV
jgi:putative ABC transport system permease protein